MKGLLLVLCAIVTLLAIFAGGCGLIFSGIVVFGRGDEPELLLVALSVMAVAFCVMAVNVALITALRRGQAPRRSTRFVLLAVVDLLAAVALTVGIAADGDLLPGVLLPAALALKGVLTLLLPVRPAELPHADAGTRGS